jgi:hypothetical protein
MLLRTDSVHRGSCISFLTRAMICLASCILSVFFTLKAFLGWFVVRFLVRAESGNRSVLGAISGSHLFPLFGRVRNGLPYEREASGISGCSSGRIETFNDIAVCFCCVVSRAHRREMLYVCSSSVAGVYIGLCHMAVTDVFRRHHLRIASSVCMVTMDRSLQSTQWNKRLKSSTCTFP